MLEAAIQVIQVIRVIRRTATAVPLVPFAPRIESVRHHGRAPMRTMRTRAVGRVASSIRENTGRK